MKRTSRDARLQEVDADGYDLMVLPFVQPKGNVVSLTKLAPAVRHARSSGHRAVRTDKVHRLAAEPRAIGISDECASKLLNHRGAGLSGKSADKQLYAFIHSSDNVAGSGREREDVRGTDADAAQAEAKAKSEQLDLFTR